MTVAGSEAGALSRRVPGAWGKSPSQDKVLPPKGCSREMGSWDEMCLGAAAPKKQGSSACLGTVEADDHDISGIMVLQATGFPPTQTSQHTHGPLHSPADQAVFVFNILVLASFSAA